MGLTTLWHVSERGDLEVFEPRPQPADPTGPGKVWAVDEAHLDHYLVPRDCPRVGYRRGPAPRASDVEQFLGFSDARVVMAIEAEWLRRCQDTTLWAYAMPTEAFQPFDLNAGYYTASRTVHPMSVREIGAPLSLLIERGCELRVVPRLRPLAAAVAASSLSFSIIRLRNARDV